MARIDIENHHNLQSYLLNQKEVELIEAINQLFMFMYVNTGGPHFTRILFTRIHFTRALKILR